MDMSSYFALSGHKDDDRLRGYSNPADGIQNAAIRRFYNSNYSWPYIMNQKEVARAVPPQRYGNFASQYSFMGKYGRAYPNRWNPQ
jgi:hypothetical protein